MLLVFVLCTQDTNPGGNFYPNFTSVSKGELSGDDYSSEGERLAQNVNTRIWQIKHA